MESLADVFERNVQVMTANLEGLDEDELRQAVVGGGNSVAWLLGHIVFWRHALASSAEASDSPPPPERVLIFRGLDRGDYPGLGDWSVAEIRERLTESEGMVRSALANGDCDPDRAAQLLWHETYHIGQLGVMRRVLGRAGAVGR